MIKNLFLHEKNLLEMAFYHLKERESICHFWQMGSLSLVDKMLVEPIDFTMSTFYAHGTIIFLCIYILHLHR